MKTGKMEELFKVTYKGREKRICFRRDGRRSLRFFTCKPEGEKKEIFGTDEITPEGVEQYVKIKMREFKRLISAEQSRLTTVVQTLSRLARELERIDGQDHLARRLNGKAQASARRAAQDAKDRIGEIEQERMALIDKLASLGIEVTV